MRIALLETELPQIHLLVAALAAQPNSSSDTMSCTQFTDAKALRSALTDEIPFDLLILDYNHEEPDGLALLRWLRNYRRSKVPVIMLSQRNTERDVAEALAAGADDVVAKPFRPIEFKARVERFRPAKNTNGRAERYGRWTLFHDNALVLRAGPPDRVFDLCEREFSLAVAFFRHLGHVVSRAELLEATNQIGRAMNTRILDNQIFKLRKTLALEESGLLLQTVYGRGYRLVEDTRSGREQATRSGSSFDCGITRRGLH
jgi:DNA-binding response OmpR family regulator